MLYSIREYPTTLEFHVENPNREPNKRYGVLILDHYDTALYTLQQVIALLEEMTNE